MLRVSPETLREIATSKTLRAILEYSKVELNFEPLWKLVGDIEGCAENDVWRATNMSINMLADRISVVEEAHRSHIYPDAES